MSFFVGWRVTFVLIVLNSIGILNLHLNFIMLIKMGICTIILVRYDCDRTQRSRIRVISRKSTNVTPKYVPKIVKKFENVKTRLIWVRKSDLRTRVDLPSNCNNPAHWPAWPGQSIPWQLFHVMCPLVIPYDHTSRSRAQHVPRLVLSSTGLAKRKYVLCMEIYTFLHGWKFRLLELINVDQFIVF